MTRRKPPPPPALSFQDDTALQTPGPARDRLIAQMRKQGAKNVRINAIYGRVKGAEGYSKLDDEVNALRAAGIRPQMTLMATPEYMPTADQTLSSRNNAPRAWQQFAQEVAAHFKGRVGRYSVGNEMNLPGFLHANDAGARQGGRAYRGIYRGGYAGIKAADPTAQVLMGELVGAKDTRQFLAGALGGKGLKTSGLAYHPYDAYITGQQATARNAWDINSLPNLQQTLERYKRQGRLQTAKGEAAPLYLTEMGYFRGGKLSDAQRVKLLGAAYAKAKAAGARQFTAYQLAPTARRQIETGPSQSPEGDLIPGSVTQDPSWVWDTSLTDAAGNLPTINRGMRIPARNIRARAAQARRR